jgi:hypothetical protein
VEVPYFGLSCVHNVFVLGLSFFVTWAGRVAQSIYVWLRAGRFRDRLPVGARFFAPVQTGPGSHPASYTMGTGSFPAIKWPGRDVDHIPPSRAEVTKE